MQKWTGEVDCVEAANTETEIDECIAGQESIHLQGSLLHTEGVRGLLKSRQTSCVRDENENVWVSNLACVSAPS